MHTVRVTLSPAWSGDTVSSVSVRLELDLPAKAGEPLFRVFTQIIDKPFAALESPFRLADREGDVPCRTEDCPEDMGTVRVFIPERDADAPVLSYTVRTAPAGRNPVLDLGSEPGGATGSGKTFLPAFFAGGPIRCELTWDMSAMPEDAAGAWTWGEGDSARVGDGSTLISAFFAVGTPLDCVRIGAFRYYWFRSPKLLETAVDAARIFSAESAFFPDPRSGDPRSGDNDSLPYSIFTRHGEECVHPGGTADSRAYLWLYRDVAQLDASLKFLFAHEMVHNWINAPDEPYGTCTWYVEGMAEFYSLVLPWRAGIVTAQELTDELNRRSADYYENPRRRETNEACGRAFLADLETTKVPYGRGLFYLLHADAAIRRASGGAHSLDDVMFALIGPDPEDHGESAGGIPSDTAAASIRFNRRWLAEYGRIVGDGTAREEFEALRSGAVWDPEMDAFQAGNRPPVRAVSHEGTERGTGTPCVTWRFEA